MAVRKIIPMLFAAALLFLRGGDCVSMLLADQNAQSCCASGHCPKSGKEADLCCKTSPSGSANSFQSEAKVVGRNLTSGGTVPSLYISSTDPGEPFLLFADAPIETVLHSPPESLGFTSLPLLI